MDSHLVSGKVSPMEGSMSIQESSSLQFSQKRRRVQEDIQTMLNHANHNTTVCQSPTGTNRNFLPLTKCDSIFHTEEWKPRGNTLFLPLLEDILVNVKKLEQISFNHGTFFVADNAGNYTKSVGGRTVHLWRYSDEDRQLYISRSFLFTNPQNFHDVQLFLRSL